MTYIADQPEGYTAREFLGRDDGVWHASFQRGRRYYLSPLPPDFDYSSGTFEVQYLNALASDLPDGSLAQETDLFLGLGRADWVVGGAPEWTTSRFELPHPYLTEHAADGYRPESFEVGFGFGPEWVGDAFIRRMRLSEQGFDLCSIAVEDPESSSGWAACPTRVGDEWCGDGCVNTRWNDHHCGTCGTVCGEEEVCERGACVPLPILRQYAPDHIEGCEPGYWGLDCASPCPGLLESGVACWGNGVCSDGLFGTGICHCTRYERHGLHCEFSCFDGVRNGLEQNIDCGGGVCGPCE